MPLSDMLCVRCAAKFTLLFTRSYASSALPRITVPHKAVQNTRKLNMKKIKKNAETASRKLIDRGSLLISCHRKTFNHYMGVRTSNKPGLTNKHLASAGWAHYKSVGDHFTINTHRGNPALEGEAALYPDFTSLDLSPQLVTSLSDQNIIHPTNIQALMVPAMLSGRNILCAAETGSGKTLAYLLPILHRIQQYKSLDRNLEFNTPYAIVLTSCRELADQLQRVATSICPSVGCEFDSICGGLGTQSLLWKTPEKPCDLLIATPGILRKVLRTKLYHTSRLMHLVFDEADTLMDDSFRDLTLEILSRLKVTSEKIADVTTGDSSEIGGTQVALVSATMPTRVADILKHTVPMNTIERISTKFVHRLMPHVTQKFYRVNGQTKPERFLQLVKLKLERPIIVFCKNSKTASYVGYLLEENGVNNVVAHGNMPAKVRSGRIEEFLTGQSNILVSTDLASRGLDTMQVQRVMNYNFPTHLSDYIHRAGRVGRVGGQNNGVVYSFVQHGYELDTLWKIEAAARGIGQLEGVNANIKRKHVRRHEMREVQAAEAELDHTQLAPH